MGRRRTGAAPVDPFPGEEQLEVFSSALEGLASEQQEGKHYLGQCVLASEDRVARAPMLYSHELEPAAPMAGNAPRFAWNQFKVDRPNLALLAVPVPQMPRIPPPLAPGAAAVAAAAAAAAAHPAPAAKLVLPATRYVSKAEVELVETLRRKGVSWDDIARHFPGRTGTQVRKRYHSHIRQAQETPAKAFRSTVTPMVIGSGERGERGSEPRAEAPPRGEGRELRSSAAAAAATSQAQAQGAQAQGSQAQAQGAQGPQQQAGDEYGMAAKRPRLSVGPGMQRDSSRSAISRDTPDREAGMTRARSRDADGGNGGGSGNGSTPQPQPQPQPPPAPQELLAPGMVRLQQPVNAFFTDRSGGDKRVKLRGPCAPPAGTTVAEAHGLPSLEGVKFYWEAEVRDPEDPEIMYHFQLDNHPAHCACFHLGRADNGEAVISWSDVAALYELPDGGRWAEHGYLHDAEDIKDLAELAGLPQSRIQELLPPDLAPNELLRRRGRYHSRLHDIEMECWVYKDKVPADCTHNPSDTFFWRYTFDPKTLRRCAPGDGLGGCGDEAGAGSGTQQQRQQPHQQQLQAAQQPRPPALRMSPAQQLLQLQAAHGRVRVSAGPVLQEQGAAVSREEAGAGGSLGLQAGGRRPQAHAGAVEQQQQQPLGQASSPSAQRCERPAQERHRGSSGGGGGEAGEGPAAHTADGAGAGGGQCSPGAAGYSNGE